jgi:hypothetical protein
VDGNTKGGLAIIRRVKSPINCPIKAARIPQTNGTGKSRDIAIVAWGGFVRLSIVIWMVSVGVMILDILFPLGDVVYPLS